MAQGKYATCEVQAHPSPHALTAGTVGPVLIREYLINHAIQPQLSYPHKQELYSYVPAWDWQD